MIRLRRERERVLAEDQETIVADVGNAGLGVFRHHDSGRDVRTAVLRAVGRDRKACDVDVAINHYFLAWGVAIDDCRQDRLIEAGEHLWQNGLFVGLEGEKRLVARRIDAAYERKLSSVLGEIDCRPRASIA